MTHSEVVARMVQQARSAAPAALPARLADPERGKADIYVDYAGHRTHANFDALTRRVDVVDGPLTGQSFKSPSSAARAVVSHYKPGVSPQRNGWTFWTI